MSIEKVIRRRPWMMRALAGPLLVRRRINARLRRPFDQAVSAIIASIEGDVLLRAKQFDGTFFISSNSDLFRRFVNYGEYEPELVAAFRRSVRSDRDIIDVGANIGFFSVLGAKLLSTGRVLAVEPTAAAFERLEKNVARNNVSSQVILHRGAASCAPGEITLNVVPGREEYSSMGTLAHPAVRDASFQTETANAMPLDMLVKEYCLRPALIKVDVEGAEALVFAGATEILSRFRPTVISELTPNLLKKMGTDAQDVISIFERADYIVSDLHDPAAKPGTREFGDIICIPKN